MVNLNKKTTKDLFTKSQNINFNPLQAASNSQSNKSVKFQYFVPCMSVRNVCSYFLQKKCFSYFFDLYLI